MNLRGADAGTTVKRLKDMTEVRAVDSDTTICNGDPNLIFRSNPSAGHKCPDGNMRVVATIFHCIADQVLQALRHPRRVSHDHGDVGLDASLNNDSWFPEKVLDARHNRIDNAKPG